MQVIHHQYSQFHRCFKLCNQGIVVSQMAGIFIGHFTFTMQVVLTWRGKLQRRLHPGLEAPPSFVASILPPVGTRNYHRACTVYYHTFRPMLGLGHKLHIPGATYALDWLDGYFYL